VFCDEIEGFSFAPERISDYLAKADETLVEKERLLTLQQTEQQKLQQEITRVYRLYQDGQLDSVGFGKFYKPLEERQKQLEDDIPRLQAHVDLQRVNTLSAQEVASEARTRSKRWPTLEAEERRQIFEVITEKIVIGKGRISVTFYQLPSCKEVAEGVGFEPTAGLPLLLISSQVPLTTQPPFHLKTHDLQITRAHRLLFVPRFLSLSVENPRLRNKIASANHRFHCE
jgi:hypothetical protein